jgi:hypothetical protein
LTLDLGTENGTPIYTMVFATDHPAGDRIMTSVLKGARDIRRHRRASTSRRNSALTVDRRPPDDGPARLVDKLTLKPARRTPWRGKKGDSVAS